MKSPRRRIFAAVIAMRLVLLLDTSWSGQGELVVRLVCLQRSEFRISPTWHAVRPCVGGRCAFAVHTYLTLFNLELMLLFRAHFAFACKSLPATWLFEALFASIALGVVYERPSIAEKRLFSFSNKEVCCNVGLGPSLCVGGSMFTLVFGYCSSDRRRSKR